MQSNSDSMIASEIIRNKLIAAGGSAIIQMLNGNSFKIAITHDGKAFETKKLPGVPYGFNVFDIIVDLLHEQNGKARKGAGRGKANKLGGQGCELDTVVGAIAYRYAGRKLGESVYDPVFALAAILDWAEICYNERGVLALRKYL